MAGSLVIGCALAFSSAARAQTVEVASGDRCLTQPAIIAAMKRYTPRVAPDPGLRARVRPSTRGLSFEVLRDGEVLAERTFETLPRRCAERARAVAIAIALAFESVRARDREPATEPPKPAAPSADAPTDTSEPASSDAVVAPLAPPAPVANESAARTPAERPKNEPPPGPNLESARATPSLVIAAGAGVLVSVLPEPALIAAFGVGLPLVPALRLELTGLASSGVTTQLADGVVDSRLFGGQAALCAGFPWGPLRLAGCAGVAAAVVPATGRDFSVSGKSTTTGWTACLLAATLDLRLVGPLSVRGSAAVLASLVRPVLEARVDGEARDATPFPLGGLISVHVLWAMP